MDLRYSEVHFDCAGILIQKLYAGIIAVCLLASAGCDATSTVSSGPLFLTLEYSRDVAPSIGQMLDLTAHVHNATGAPVAGVPVHVVTQLDSGVSKTDANGDVRITWTFTRNV